MVERATTGGIMDFTYNKDETPELSKNEKNEIKDAYAQAAERKRKEKRNKLILIVVGIIALLIISLLIFKPF